MGSATEAPARRAARGRGLIWKLRVTSGWEPSGRAGTHVYARPGTGVQRGGRGPAETRAARAAPRPHVCSDKSRNCQTHMVHSLRTRIPKCINPRLLFRKTCGTQGNLGHLLFPALSGMQQASVNTEGKHMPSLHRAFLLLPHFQVPSQEGSQLQRACE